MKRLLVPLAFSLLFLCCRAPAEDPVVDKLKALFPRADQDHSGSLSSDEQAKTLEEVRKGYGVRWAKQLASLFGHAAAADQSVSKESWQKQVEDYARPLETRTERVAMRDGIKLATDIYLPRGTGPFPVVFSRTPYHRVNHNESAPSFVQNGYACAVQDMRGRFESEGENLPYIGCGWGEHQDGVDTIAWLLKQPWCDGTIVTIGGSAGGITQNLLAGAAPQGLKAQYIKVAAAKLYGDASCIGGAFRKMDVENWLRGNKFDPRALEIGLAHPSYDDHWKTYDTTTKFAVMNVPAVHIGGWFDMFAQSTIDEFCGRQHQGAPGSRGTQKLIMGPWTHALGQMPAGELTFPGANQVPERYNPGRWFDHYACNEDNGVEKEPAVAYYVMGDTSTTGAPGNEWRFADDWPVPAKETPIYLTRDKRAGMVAPSTGAAHLEYTFDPADPCPTVGGNNLTKPRGSFDQRKVESRSDALVFTSDPLEKPLEITGRLLAKLFVSSSAVDTDLSVRICDVYPDGRSFLIAEGMQRLRYRNSCEKPELLTPGKIEEISVDCWSTSLIFNTNHRIRVLVTSSNFPRFDVNPGTGQPGSDNGERVKQINRIYCDAEHPSRILAPVVTSGAR